MSFFFDKWPTCKQSKQDLSFVIQAKGKGRGQCLYELWNDIDVKDTSKPLDQRFKFMPRILLWTFYYQPNHVEGSCKLFYYKNSITFQIKLIYKLNKHPFFVNLGLFFVEVSSSHLVPTSKFGPNFCCLFHFGPLSFVL